MDVQRRPIRPFFDEDEMAGVFLVDEEVVGDAEVFLLGLLDKLAVERQDDLNGLRLDEVLGDDLEHKATLSFVIGHCPRVQCPVVQGSMIETLAALKALASRVATAKPWAVAMAAM